MAVNKVAKSDGTTLIDITPTTAIQSDVAKDKIFFLADGRQAVGTNEGGSGSVTWETMVDQTCTIATYDGMRIVIINGYDEPLSADETYRITWGDTQYICETKADPSGQLQDGYYIGNGHIVESSYEDTGEPVIFYRTSSTRMTGVTNDTDSSVYVKIEKQVTSSATLVTKTIAANGTYSASSDGADGYSQVTVNVPTSAGAAMNTQVAQGVKRVATTSYTAVNGQSITVETTGTYDVYWTGFRSSTGGTNGSQLYIDNVAYDSAQTAFTNHGQSVKLTGVQLTEGQVITVRARARGTNYYMYVGNLTIVQTA